MEGDEGRLREARTEGRIQDLRKRGQQLRAQLTNERRIVERVEADLAERRVRVEFELRRDVWEGLIYTALTIAAILGVVYLMELSFRVFLPTSTFSPAWQFRIAIVLALGTILAFHLLLSGGSDERLRVPRGLLWTSVLSFVLGLVLLGVIRGLFVGTVGLSDVETLSNLEWWVRVLGVGAFVLLGLGLDIGGGIAGALAWAKIAGSLPALKWYRRRDTARSRITEIELDLAELEPQILPANPGSGDPSGPGGSAGPGVRRPERDESHSPTV